MVERMIGARRRDGAETRQEALRVALDLFTEQGYEATSLRQIADALGINKASLYYHFPNKEAILRSVFERRGSEAAELLAWAERQPRSPELIREAVLRWVDSFSAEKLQGIRFLRGNPFIGRALADAEGDRIGDPLGRLSDLLVGLLPEPDGADAVLVRMALLSINAAVEAAVGADVPDTDVIAAARAAADALVREVLAR
ncbi:TetR/AcrR family transcriptional regulator [Amnibacterium setariae]|nr:helix-turn-helix domain-containing protein [Amnibacterium setariae]